MDGEDCVEEVLDAIGDEHARTVLAALNRRPASAKELTTRLDLSQPTVYRRLETLQEHDLIVERTLVAEDGNHYKEYRCNFRSALLSLEEDTYDVQLVREEGLPERFADLWDELGVNG